MLYNRSVGRESGLFVQLARGGHGISPLSMPVNKSPQYAGRFVDCARWSVRIFHVRPTIHYNVDDADADFGHSFARVEGAQASRARGRNGFVRSLAPYSKTRTSLSSSPFAVSTITGRRCRRARASGSARTGVEPRQVQIEHDDIRIRTIDFIIGFAVRGFEHGEAPSRSI